MSCRLTQEQKVGNTVAASRDSRLLERIWTVAPPFCLSNLACSLTSFALLPLYHRSPFSPQRTRKYISINRDYQFYLHPVYLHAAENSRMVSSLWTRSTAWQ